MMENPYTKYLAPELPDGSEDQLDLAKKRLRAMLWLGVLERWQESLVLFETAFDTKLNLYTPVFNYNYYNKNVSSFALEVLETHQQQDRKLYTYALELFDKRISKVPKTKFDQKYICDETVICWNKKGNGNFWYINQTTQLNYTLKYMKMNVLCAPQRGCWKTSN